MAKANSNQNEAMSMRTSPEKSSIWTSSSTAYDSEQIHFSGFEPCFVTCIKDLELRISTLLEKCVGNGNGVEIPSGLEELLMRYSHMIKALETSENREPVFEAEDADSKRVHFHGVQRQVQRAKDLDVVYESLKLNWLVKFLDKFCQYDLPRSLRDRFGNLSLTVDRLLVGLAGGFSMLVPMLIMAFATSRTARLIVVSVATIIFANFMALTSVSKENVVASTAAYAAVMVVFIGSAEGS